MDELLRPRSRLSCPAALAAYANEPEETAYQTAMVVAVDTVAAESNYVGVSPTDAPLGPQTYAYDVRIRLNCNVYTHGTNRAPTCLNRRFRSESLVRCTTHGSCRLRQSSSIARSRSASLDEND